MLKVSALKSGLPAIDGDLLDASERHGLTARFARSLRPFLDARS
jgi:hypothetical protein